MKTLPLRRYRAWLAGVGVLVLLGAWWAAQRMPPLMQAGSAVAAAGVAAAAPLDAASGGAVAAGSADAPGTTQAGTAAAAPAADQAIVDIFAVRTWEPPPPPPAPVTAAAPPQPQAPPLPFRFMGRIAEPGKDIVFLLTEGDRVLQAKVGDTIAGAYRLEEFDRGQLVFRYQPMNIVQTLAVGDAP